MSDELLNSDTESPSQGGRIVENVLVRPERMGNVNVSWTSDAETTRSWIFLNGKLIIGPFMAGTRERSIIIPVPNHKTFKIEVHDCPDDTVPQSMEELPMVKPLIAWNAVESAVGYRIYHTIFDTGSIESLLVQVPPLSNERIEIDCPKQLEGRGGRWHLFRVESVDQFGNESENEIVPYFAADLPPPPTLAISRNTETGLMNFRII